MLEVYSEVLEAWHEGKDNGDSELREICREEALFIPARVQFDNQAGSPFPIKQEKQTSHCKRETVKMIQQEAKTEQMLQRELLKVYKSRNSSQSALLHRAERNRERQRETERKIDR